MAINTNLHKFVLIIDQDYYGFDVVSNAIDFVSQQVTDQDKVIDFIVDCLTDGVDIDGKRYQIITLEAYMDAYAGDDEDNE